MFREIRMSEKITDETAKQTAWMNIKPEDDTMDVEDFWKKEFETASVSGEE